MALLFLCLGFLSFLRGMTALGIQCRWNSWRSSSVSRCLSLSVLTDRAHKALPALLTKQKTQFSISTVLFASCKGKSHFIYKPVILDSFWNEIKQTMELLNAHEMLFFLFTFLFQPSYLSFIRVAKCLMRSPDRQA